MVSIAYMHEYDIVIISFVCLPPKHHERRQQSIRFVLFASAVGTHTLKYVCIANTKHQHRENMKEENIGQQLFHILFTFLLSVTSTCVQSLTTNVYIHMRMEVRMPFVNDFVSAIVVVHIRMRNKHKYQLNLFMTYNLLHSLL